LKNNVKKRRYVKRGESRTDKLLKNFLSILRYGYLD